MHAQATFALKQLLIAISVLAIFSIGTTNKSFAELDTSKISIIQNCEKIYPDLDKLGREKFQQRHLYNKDLRSCLKLYHDIAWGSTDPDRLERLASALDTPLVTKIIRDRTSESEGIPKWIKDDATRWYQGKERDNILSYGIRHMINSNIIPVQQILSHSITCSDVVCLTYNDYLTYSISETNKETVVVKHTVQQISSSLLIVSDQITKKAKSTEFFQINKEGLVQETQKCCIYYQFAHKVPLEVGSKVNSIKELTVTHEILFRYKDIQRPAFIAKDSTGYYQEVIDKETGIVLFSKNQDNIRKVTKTATLTDTNAFSKNIRIEYEDMKIPPWFRNTVKWWSQGQISDTEYILSLSYMIKNNILRI
ncbi:conserved hypothetical protein [Candidatus Nitrosotenuis uzonensis]|uniref:Uncharacterized protein n=1 Tax=Candidatus Nitrosotenuis uzonensis TaxID=1407055 RepID=A0A812F0M0_9ARCH|nr:conserved hypothetical protein [Candidatus Nitrosotenuis uzonensis]